MPRLAHYYPALCWPDDYERLPIAEINSLLVALGKCPPIGYVFAVQPPE